MDRLNLAGSHTALVTPFLPDRSVDWEGFGRNIAFQTEQGISGVLAVGTTGESPSLDWEEHDRAIESAIEAAAGRCRVMAGTGSNSTKEALRASRHAAEAGAEALLLVDCYYNGPSSLELRREYHGRVAEACPDCTIVPYIIPGRTGAAMSPEDLAILAAERPNVTAVKEATGDIERMARTRSLVGDAFDILSGDDGITFQIMLDERIEADGVVSVVSNVAPAAVARMVDAALAGESAQAAEIANALEPLFQIVTVVAENERAMPDGTVRMVRDKFRNPLAIKTLMAGLGMPAGPARPPLGKMTSTGLAIVRDAARATWQESAWILEPIGEAYGVDVGARIEDDAAWEGLTYD
ncbi:MAG: 4-hydroxy-tetrahydrodipicolinate synthase [Planctomycetota bacterium]